MFRLGKICRAAVFTCLVLVGGCSGENKPSEAELREALVLKLPEYMKVTDFSIDVMENTGNEVDPDYVARFNAKAEIASALYARDGSEGNLVFLLGTNEAGAEIELFGKSSSTLFQGGWAHNLYVEGDTLSKLGRPLTEFAELKTIVRGSAEETAHFDAIKVQHAEFESTLAALPVHELIAKYYDTAGEFAGQYVIGEVINSRAEKQSNEQFVVHARYSYKRAAESKLGGEDRRTFTFQKLQDQWQVVAMGFARSGRID